MISWTMRVWDTLLTEECQETAELQPKILVTKEWQGQPPCRGAEPRAWGLQPWNLSVRFLLSPYSSPGPHGEGQTASYMWNPAGNSQSLPPAAKALPGGGPVHLTGRTTVSVSGSAVLPNWRLRVCASVHTTGSASSPNTVPHLQKRHLTQARELAGKLDLASPRFPHQQILTSGHTQLGQRSWGWYLNDRFGTHWPILSGHESGTDLNLLFNSPATHLVPQSQAYSCFIWGLPAVSPEKESLAGVSESGRFSASMRPRRNASAGNRQKTENRQGNGLYNSSHTRLAVACMRME